MLYWLYTEPMEKFFADNGEEYKPAKLKVVCQPQDSKKVDSKIVIWCEMGYTKDGTGKYAPTHTQKALAAKMGLTCSGSLDRILPLADNKAVELVSEQERGMDFEDLKPILDTRIADFQSMLDDFTKKYL